jgi:hypothetical protein
MLPKRYGSPQLPEEVSVLLLEPTLGEPPAGTSVHQLSKLLSVEVKEVLEVHTTIGELLEHSFFSLMHGVNGVCEERQKRGEGEYRLIFTHSPQMRMAMGTLERPCATRAQRVTVRCARIGLLFSACPS